MISNSTLVSPKQVARAIGVSESSLKRWCDQGRIKTVRTVGGHRKMPLGEVVRYARDNRLDFVSPDVLGLPATSAPSPGGTVDRVPRLVDALLAGNEPLARQVIADLYLSGHPISSICDELIAAAFHEIGNRWECRTADVYQERRACEICLRILIDFRRMQPQPDSKCLAIGGTIEGDQYTLPSTMAELVLREAGFQAACVGTSIPIASLARAVKETKPRLFWLSVSYIDPSVEFVNEFTQLSEACSTSATALVVGGRALTADLRQRLTYSAYCDNMRQLENLAATLRRPAKPVRRAAIATHQARARRSKKN